MKGIQEFDANLLSYIPAKILKLVSI